MKNKRILRYLVVLGILIYWSCFSAFLYAAQTKTPSSKSAVKQTGAQLPLNVHGVVWSEGKGLKGVEISLVQVAGAGRSLPVEKHTTDDTGHYSFLIAPENTGKNYEIHPRYLNFPTGQYFTPNVGKFTLSGNMKIDFQFHPPHVKIKGMAVTSDGRKIMDVEVSLSEVLGTHQFKYIGSQKTNVGGLYAFELDNDKLGKKFLIRPRHPQLTIIGLYFTPNEKEFKLTGDTTINFVYNGPLPDLLLTNKQLLPNAQNARIMIFTITNQGGLASGPCTFEMGYNEYSKSTQANPYKTVKRPVPGLEAGTSHDIEISLPPDADKEYKFRRTYVDCFDTVIESNEKNNWNPPLY